MIINAINAYEKIAKDPTKKEQLFTDPQMNILIGKSEEWIRLLDIIEDFMKTGTQEMKDAFAKYCDERLDQTADPRDKNAQGYRMSDIYFRARVLSYMKWFIAHEKSTPSSYYNTTIKPTTETVKPIKVIAPKISPVVPTKSEKIVAPAKETLPKTVVLDQKAEAEFAESKVYAQHLAMENFCKNIAPQEYARVYALRDNEDKAISNSALWDPDKRVMRAQNGIAFNGNIRNVYAKIRKPVGTPTLVPVMTKAADILTPVEKTPIITTPEKAPTATKPIPKPVLKPVSASKPAPTKPVQMDVKREDRKVESTKTTTETSPEGQTRKSTDTRYDYAEVINVNFLETLRKKHMEYADPECTLDQQGTTMKRAMKMIKKPKELSALALAGPISPSTIPLSTEAKKNIEEIYSEIFGPFVGKVDPIEALNWKMIYLNGLFTYSPTTDKLLGVLTKDKVTGEFKEMPRWAPLMKNKIKNWPDPLVWKPVNIETNMKPNPNNTIETKEKEQPFGQKRYHDAALITTCSLTPENLLALQKNLARGNDMKPLQIDAGVDGRPVRERSQQKVHDAFLASQNYCTRTHPELKQLWQTILQKAKYDTYKNASAGPRFNMELLVGRAAASLIRMHEDVIRPYAIRIDRSTKKEVLTPEQQTSFLAKTLSKISIGNLTWWIRTGNDVQLQEDRYTTVG